MGLLWACLNCGRCSLFLCTSFILSDQFRDRYACVVRGMKGNFVYLVCFFLGGGSERISNCLACSFPSFSPSEAGHVLPGPKPIPLLSSQAPDDPQWINYLCFCC